MASRGDIAVSVIFGIIIEVDNVNSYLVLPKRIDGRQSSFLIAIKRDDNLELSADFIQQFDAKIRQYILTGSFTPVGNDFATFSNLWRVVGCNLSPDDDDNLSLNIEILYTKEGSAEADLAVGINIAGDHHLAGNELNDLVGGGIAEEAEDHSQSLATETDTVQSGQFFDAVDVAMGCMFCEGNPRCEYCIESSSSATIKAVKPITYLNFQQQKKKMREKYLKNFLKQCVEKGEPSCPVCLETEKGHKEWREFTLCIRGHSHCKACYAQLAEPKLCCICKIDIWEDL